MQLLPLLNFLMETFCFTEYLQFPQENGINCFMWLETHLNYLVIFFFLFSGPGVNLSMIFCHMAEFSSQCHRPLPSPALMFTATFPPRVPGQTFHTELLVRDGECQTLIIRCRNPGRTSLS